MAEFENNNVTEDYSIPEVEYFYEDEPKSDAGKLALIGLAGVGIGYGISKVAGKVKAKLAERKARKALSKADAVEPEEVTVDETAQENPEK